MASRLDAMMSERKRQRSWRERGRTSFAVLCGGRQRLGSVRMSTSTTRLQSLQMFWVVEAAPWAQDCSGRCESG